jgi:hypothetical protein
MDAVEEARKRFPGNRLLNSKDPRTFRPAWAFARQKLLDKGTPDDRD